MSSPIRRKRCFTQLRAITILLIVSLGLENFDGLRLCSQARSLERTRSVPILAIADADNN